MVLKGNSVICDLYKCKVTKVILNPHMFKQL
jgi:hypothetical protein